MENRAIFRYFDGEKNVFGDPLDLLHRANHFAGGDINNVIQSMVIGAYPRDGEGRAIITDQTDAEYKLHADERFDAEQKFQEAIRKAFEMIPFDKSTGKGAMGRDVQRAWDELMDFLEKKSQPPEPMPNSLQFSDLAVSPSPIPSVSA